MTNAVVEFYFKETYFLRIFLNKTTKNSGRGSPAVWHALRRGCLFISRHWAYLGRKGGGSIKILPALLQKL
jgi:hypothetical protein